MAENNDEIVFAKIKLTDEQRERLEKLDNVFPDLERQVEKLSKLGMATSEIRDKMKWAKEVSETLKKEF